MNADLTNKRLTLSSYLSDPHSSFDLHSTTFPPEIIECRYDLADWLIE